MAIDSRDELHALIEQIPDSELHAVQLFLRFVHAQAAGGERTGEAVIDRRPSNDPSSVLDADANDPVALALAHAPDDDEPSTADEDADAEAGWQAYRRGEFIPHEDVRREIGW